MHSVLRNSLNFDSEDAVEIPDVEFKPVDLATLYNKNNELSEENEEAPEESYEVEGFDMSGYTEEQRIQVATFLNEKIAQLNLKNQNEADFMRAKAEEEYKNKMEQIDADGEKHRQEIIKHAQMQAGEIFEKARQQGMKAGKQEKLDEISQTILQLEETLQEMKALQNERFDSFSDEIKWLSCDVASALVYKKIDEDDLFLRELVKAAVKEAKGAEWISVELSDKLGNLVAQLKKDFENSDVKTEFETVSDKDVGDVVVNGSDRKVVASVREQLSNIREYFRSFEEFDDSQEN
ncbi:MAG: hypothetical protein IJ031_00345 [Oscillospiraceae bacterium]|nr:hypothetical protein [Oscillospiraceae bacterium]